jgi:energy-converting hydrogenase Eha subunit A
VTYLPALLPRLVYSIIVAAAAKLSTCDSDHPVAHATARSDAFRVKVK